MWPSRLRTDDGSKTQDESTTASHADAVRAVSTTGLTGPDNLDHLTPLKAKVSRHGIRLLDSRQLGFLQPIPLQQLLFLLGVQRFVLWHQMVVCDVDQQERLLEILEVKRSAHGVDHFSRGARHFFGPDDNAALDIAFFHNRDKLSHRLDAHVSIARVEDEKSLVFVLAVLGEKVELVSVHRTSRRRIFGFERLQIHRDLIVSYLVASITNEFVDGAIDTP